MKKILLPFMLLLAMITSLAGQKVVYADHAEKREIGSFHAIETSAGIEVLITRGPKEELAVWASDKDLIGKLHTDVVNGVLKITRDNEWKFWKYKNNWKIKVYVSYTTLDGIEANSGASIKGEDVQLSRLTVKLSSGALVELSGNTESLKVRGASGSQFNGYDFKSIQCEAAISSGAEAKLNVAKEIAASASSGGSISYKGDASLRDIHVSSGGEVKRN